MIERQIYRDYPIDEVVKQINERRASSPAKFRVHQKWTCKHCGSRQSMAEADKFFRSGVCEACGNTTIIDKCNYLAVFGDA